jgi:hypothetical protein
VRLLPADGSVRRKEQLSSACEVGCFRAHRSLVMTISPSDLSPAEVLTAVNHAWSSGRLEDLECLLHPRSVIVGPDLTRLADGRGACVASYRDFLAAVTIHKFEVRDVQTEEYEGTAVVSYGYQISYDSGGEQHDDDGRELLVLVSTEHGWQVVWRQVVVAL